MDDLAMLSALRWRLAVRHVIGVSDGELADVWELLGGELRRRIGAELAERLADGDLGDFARCRGAGGDVVAWLETHLPEYGRIVAIETERMLDDCADWFGLRHAASGIG